MSKTITKSQFKPHALEYFRQIQKTTKDEKLLKYPHVKSLW